MKTKQVLFYASLMCINLSALSYSSQGLACSLPPPTEEKEPEVFVQPASLVMLKVTKIEKDLAYLEERKAIIAREDQIINEKIARFMALQDTTVSAIDLDSNEQQINSLKSELKKLQNQLDDSKRKIADLTEQYRYIQSDDVNQARLLFEKRKSLIEKFKTTSQKLNKQKTDLQALQLKDTYERDDVNYLADEIEKLEKELGGGESYYGPLKLTLQVIKSLGVNRTGEELTTDFNYFPPCGAYDWTDFAYDANEGNVVIAAYKTGSEDFPNFRGAEIVETPEFENTMQAMYTGEYKGIERSLFMSAKNGGLANVDFRVGRSSTKNEPPSDRIDKGLSINLEQTQDGYTIKNSREFKRQVKIMAIFEDGTSEVLTRYKPDPLAPKESDYE